MLKNVQKISENSDVFDFFVLILSIEMDFLMCPLVETWKIQFPTSIIENCIDYFEYRLLKHRENKSIDTSQISKY